MKCPVTTLDNKASGEIELDDAIFALPVRKDILSRMVNWQLAKRRAGTHKVKSRGEVTGTTRKLYRQKGTGRARIGDGKVSQFRSGGVAFGPKPRDHSHDLPKKVRRLALKTALSAKAAEGNLVVVEDLTGHSGKTKEMADKLSALGWDSVLLVDGQEVDQNLMRATRNLPGVDVLPQQGANVYDILRRSTLVLTKDAVAQLEARLK